MSKMLVSSRNEMVVREKGTRRSHNLIASFDCDPLTLHSFQHLCNLLHRVNTVMISRLLPYGLRAHKNKNVTTYLLFEFIAYIFRFEIRTCLDLRVDRSSERERDQEIRPHSNDFEQSNYS